MAIVAVLLGLVFVSYVIRVVIRRVGRRTDKTGLSVTLDDAENMAKTGLLTPEEIKRVRQSISRQWLEANRPDRSRLGELPLEAAEALRNKERASETSDVERASTEGGGMSASGNVDRPARRVEN